MYTPTSLNSSSILRATIRQDVALIFIADYSQDSLRARFRRYSYILTAFLAFFSFEPHGGYAASVEKEFIVTAYYSPLPGQDFYLKGNYEAEKLLNGDGTHGASGKPVFAGMVAAPKSYPFGTRIDFAGLGVGVVEDRGGAIVTAGERGQSYDRIDIWMGSGEAGLHRAMIWGKRKVKGTIITDATRPLISLVDIDSGKINLSQFSKAGSMGVLNSGLSASILAMFDDLGYPKEDGQTEKEMIIEFQLDHGIIRSRDEDGAGNYGPKTRATLEKEHDLYVSLRNAELEKIEAEKSLLIAEKNQWESAYSSASQTVSAIGSPTRGEKGQNVLSLQSLLRTSGYLRVKATGIMNAPTILAIKSLQKEHKIPPTGKIDPRTQEALIAALVENA